jgi:predicted RNase H-like nuclease
MSVVGVDGCPSGWFAVRLEAGGHSCFDVFPRIEDLWSEWQDASLILIDIPIGLSDTNRQCDTDARAVLGRPRHSSVFPTPCRAALGAPNYKEASETNRRVTNRGLSKQSYGILPKIKEIDEFVRRNLDARSRIREVHPEVCFWAFNGAPMTHSKHEQDGFEERLGLLCQLDAARTDFIVKGGLGKFLQREVGRDDILDALVAAVTADCDPNELRTFPRKQQLDECGLPMGIVYRHQTMDRTIPRTVTS